MSALSDYFFELAAKALSDATPPASHSSTRVSGKARNNKTEPVGNAARPKKRLK